MPSYQIKIDLTFETEADSKDIVESLNTLFDESEDYINVCDIVYYKTGHK